MKKILSIIVFSFIFFYNCSSSTESEGERIGAVCKDGTTSTATGSGACSNHGGVDHWIYR